MIDFNPRQIIVTGGAGFIGSAMVRYILANTDATVVNLDALTYAASPDTLKSVSADSRHVFHHLNILDAEAVQAVFQTHAPDAVIHLAAESHVDRSIDGPATFIQTNINGTYVMLEESLRYWRTLKGEDAAGFRFLHVSTDEVFGSLGAEGMFTEKTPYAPNSPYSASKAAADHLVRAWHKTYDLPIVMSNCSNNYGPYQFPEKLIPVVLINALYGRPIPVYGRGENIRDWLFVEDHVSALWRILTCAQIGDGYNVGGNAELKNIDLVHKLCGHLDRLRPAADGCSYADLITFVEDRPGHDLRYAIDSSRLRKDLQWSAETEIDDGLRATVTWYLENECWWLPILQKSPNAVSRLGLSR